MAGLWSCHLPGSVREALLPIVAPTDFSPLSGGQWSYLDLPRVLATPSPGLLALERAADASGPTNTSIHSLI